MIGLFGERAGCFFGIVGVFGMFGFVVSFSRFFESSERRRLFDDVLSWLVELDEADEPVGSLFLDGIMLVTMAISFWSLMFVGSYGGFVTNVDESRLFLRVLFGVGVGVVVESALGLDETLVFVVDDGFDGFVSVFGLFCLFDEKKFISYN